MGFRPFNTTGIAVASAGALIAAMPAIVPSPTPPDVTVAAAVPDSVYADVALRQSTQDLLNAFFSGYPDTNGPAGAVGLALLFSDEAFGEGSPQSAFIEGGIVGLARSFFPDDTVAAAFLDGGIVGVAALLTEGVPLVNSFFDGFSPGGPTGIVGVLDELTAANPQANAFVTGGIVGLADLLTQDNDLANAFVTGGIVGLVSELVPDDTLLQTFVDGGFVAVAEEVTLSLTTDPVVQGGITSFFSGYPPAGANDEPPAGPAGVVGLTHYVLDALTGNIQPAPTTASVMAELSEPETGSSLLAATTGPADTQDLPEANAPVNSNARTFNLNLGTQLNTGAVDPVDTTDSVDTTDPVDTIDPTTLDTTDPTTVDSSDPDPTVTPVAATTGSGSGSAPAAQPPVAPTTPPTTDPVVDPVDPVSTEGDADDSKKVTEEELNSGNKFEPTPILLENGAGGGGSAWDETVKRWQDFGSKLGLGGGAAEPDDGAAEGSEAGS